MSVPLSIQLQAKELEIHLTYWSELKRQKYSGKPVFLSAFQKLAGEA
jgi:hypothetical protein